MVNERAPDELTAGVAPYDVFVDMNALSWSASKVVGYLKKLRDYCGFGAVGARFCAALPTELEGSSIDPGFAVVCGKGPLAFNMASRQAAARGRALCVVVAPVLPPNECLLALNTALQLDPMLGSTQPRFSDAANDLIYPLPSLGEGTGDATLQRGALVRLPTVVITAEMFAAVTLLRPCVVESIAADDVQAYTTTSGALLAALLAARRRGFRNAVANRAIVGVAGYEIAYPALADRDLNRLEGRYPDQRKAVDLNQALPMRALERAMSGMYSKDGRLRVLLDCRGVAPVHNGTSRCVLGLLDGIAKAAPGWEINVLTQKAAFRFHDMQRRYPAFVHSQDPPRGGFAAALLPNQPWSLKTIAELHRHSWAVTFNMLDTIAWDILYPLDDQVESAWRFLTEYADGIAYNSRYTQERVRFRFPIGTGRVERVVHHSLSAEDHSVPLTQRSAESNHVLLFGNSYDHKDLGPTVALLTDAFPEQPFVVLGGADSGVARPNVRNIPSGKCPEEEVHSLIATAKCVVYPSFYEGFGLPLVESLAYGRVVLARSSALWHEIVSHSRLPGRVALYDTHVGLVELLGRHLAGESIPCLAAGGALHVDEAAVDWTGSARRMIDFVQACIESANAKDWLRREFALQRIGQ